MCLAQGDPVELNYHFLDHDDEDSHLFESFEAFEQLNYPY